MTNESKPQVTQPAISNFKTINEYPEITEIQDPSKVFVHARDESRPVGDRTVRINLCSILASKTMGPPLWVGSVKPDCNSSGFNYRGGHRGGSWEIHSYDRGNGYLKAVANQENNTSFDSLESAWEQRTLLNYNSQQGK